MTQTDYCVGRVLDELEALGLEPDTIVVAHADHGWQVLPASSQHFRVHALREARRVGQWDTIY